MSRHSAVHVWSRWGIPGGRGAHRIVHFVHAVWNLREQLVYEPTRLSNLVRSSWRSWWTDAGRVCWPTLRRSSGLDQVWSGADRLATFQREKLKKQYKTARSWHFCHFQISMFPFFSPTWSCGKSSPMHIWQENIPSILSQRVKSQKKSRWNPSFVTSLSFLVQLKKTGTSADRSHTVAVSRTIPVWALKTL